MAAVPALLAQLLPATAPATNSSSSAAWSFPAVNVQQVKQSIMAFSHLLATSLLAASSVFAQGYSSSSPAFSEPHYPSPRIPGSGDWAAAAAKAKDLVSQMTLVEKVNVTTGTGWSMDRCVGNVGTVPRLGIPAICMQDSPLGVRFGDYVSAFPAGMNAAMTWDRDLIYQRGYAIGAEFKGKGVNVALGPCSGPLGRSPYSGRNWEGFSPDPWLSGVGMFDSVKGIQDAGVVATSKHYILNEQEHFRQVPEAAGYGYNLTQTLSSNIDDRTLHEAYLVPFADAVRAGTGAIMCSYNMVNNSYSCQNSHLLNGILKNELGFNGFVMSDWQAQHSGVSSALAGMDMSMPGDTLFDTGVSFWGANLTIAVLNGTVPEWRLDDQVTRILASLFYVGQDFETFPPTNFDSWTLEDEGYLQFFPGRNWAVVNEHVDVREDHAKIIREVGAKGTVLLKNEGALPLSNEKQIGIFGSDAGDSTLGPNGCSDRSCLNGTLAMGWGSGTSNFPYLITPLDAIKARAVSEGSLVQFVTNDYAYAQINSTAAQATTCLVFSAADSGEGYINFDGNEGDRNNLTLWNDGETLVNTVAAHCNNTIVVIHAVGPVILEEFIDNPNVTAVLFAGLPGQESGNSLVDVLYGDINPSGKLPFTIAKSEDDYIPILMEPGSDAPQQDFTEGLLIDYRAFDAKNITPRYEFGFGLSYTKFEYSNIYVSKIGDPLAYTPFVGMTPGANVSTTPLDPADYVFPGALNATRVPGFLYPWLNSTSQVTPADSTDPFPAAGYDAKPQKISPAGGAPGGNPSLFVDVYEVSAIVTNTGAVAGEEVVQLYLSTGLSDDPVKVLRGFEKVPLAAGESTTVRINLNRRDIMRWGDGDWIYTNGTKTVLVGGSSKKLPLSAVLY